MSNDPAAAGHVIPLARSATTVASVDDLAAGIAEQLTELQDEQVMLRKERDTINDRLKWLGVEIDKAERMTKALIPRQRRGSKNGEVTT